MQKATGVVSRWSDQKGYGFITRDGLDVSDVFVHIGALIGAHVLSVGDRVQFDVVPSARGDRAENVKLVTR